jgi:hypothetical protein
MRLSQFFHERDHQFRLVYVRHCIVESGHEVQDMSLELSTVFDLLLIQVFD